MAAAHPTELKHADHGEERRRDRRRRTRGRDGDAETWQKTAGGRQRNRVGFNESTNRIALPGQTRKPFHEFLERTAKGVEEELIASGAAEGARDEHAPEIKMSQRHAHARGDKDHLALNCGGDEDARVDEGD